MKANKISDESKALHKLYREGDIDDQALEDTMTGLALLPPQETALAVYSKPNGLDPYLDAVKDKIAEFKKSPPSLATDKGRKAYASMARKVASFKTALDAMGKELVDELKDTPKKVDAERKRIRELLDAWRDDVRQPLDDWEAEQKRIEELRLAEEAAKALAIQIENDHEIGLLLNAEFDRKREEAARAAEQARIEYEQRIAKEAAERATREAEECAAQAQRDAQLAIERAQREKAEAEARELQSKLDAEKAAERAKLAAEQAVKDAEARQQAAIEAERQRVENERLQAEAEEAKRAKNRAHAAKINNEALADLNSLGIDPETCKRIILAIVKGTIRNISISY